MSHLLCLLGCVSLLSVSVNCGRVSVSGGRKLGWWGENVAGRPCQQLGTPAPLHVEQDLAVQGRLLQVSREDAFLVGRFCGFF